MNVREVAYKCLYQIIIEGQYANLVLRNNDDVLSNVDRSLLSKIVYGTIRNYDFLSYQAAKFYKSENKKIDILINMAIYQILLLEKVPNYACVNEMVEISKKVKGGHFTSLVNAVLRKVCDYGLIEINETDELKKLSIQYSMPYWLTNLFFKQYGKEKCLEILQESSKEATVSLRCNTLKTTVEYLLQDEKFHLGKLDGCLYYDGNILETDYYKDNLVYIQNASSQLAVLTLNPIDNSKVLDMCAAPGTKSIQIGMMMHNTGIVKACELHEHRCRLIENNIRRYGLTNIKTVCVDSTQYQDEPFDYILLDAPCSGLGTLKHKPDIKCRIQPSDIDEIVNIQKELLDNAVALLKDNGTLVYSTCTLNKKENEKQIESFLLRHPEFEVIENRTIWHTDYDSDGFYVCKLVKKVIKY